MDRNAISLGSPYAAAMAAWLGRFLKRYAAPAEPAVAMQNCTPAS